MADLTRRSFLAAAAGAGIATGFAAPAWASTSRVPLTREEHRVVVIGSGFGGGVTALRLAEAGVPVLVLERGKRWPTGPNAETFPHAASPDKRALWYGSAPQLFGKPVSLAPYTGVLESVVGENMVVMTAAGVGGGSLVYQGMTLQPAEAVFNAVLPEELDYRTMARVHYPRVASMLQVATAPDELVDSPAYKAPRVFKRNAERAGNMVEKIPMPIDWSYALRELKGEMKPSYTNGDCALGVNNGGKHSVDVTYLAAAEATGLVTVAPLHNVTGISRTADGRWQIDVDRIDTSGTVLENKIITTPALVMAAGSVNTTRMLVRAAAQGAIPDLPDGLGGGWGTNGDRIYVWTNLEDDFGATQGGPVVYGTKDWADPQLANTVIQASIPPIGLDLRSTMMVGFGVSAARGKFVYNGLTGQATLKWPRDGDAAVHSAIHERATRIAGQLGTLADTNAVVPSTWHPLGGAPMGTVCDLDGRVRGQRGLYVLDGALIPGSTGACNPSMTIAAVAERALDNIVRTDVGSVI
ncbi:GMC family oxidoreductase [Amycolatopsis sp. K13G38]|uniref:Cholesterol oxidase n=1 Tax=Amycolatopsis acididurans TaxID=2724524 RepID=A0ABX1IXR0_9PSEU|nr:GMC oxidoreductase [Amycolatopsis acididurans]NKQ51549.1 GMC family oxidoreductase [Amycolatopsis acididurans]